MIEIYIVYVESTFSLIVKYLIQITILKLYNNQNYITWSLIIMFCGNLKKIILHWSTFTAASAAAAATIRHKVIILY